MIVCWDSYGIVRGTGGIRVYADCLERELRSLGVPVQVIARQGSGIGKIPLVAHSKIFTPTLNYRGLIRSLPSTTEKIVYHGLSNLNLPVLALRRPPPNMRFVLTIHDLIPELVGWRKTSASLVAQWKLLLPHAIRKADAIIAVSKWTAETIRESYPDASPKLVVIPNGFPDQKNFAGERGTKSPSDPIRIISVGRSESYKRFDLFAEMIRVAKGSVIGTLVSPEFGVKFLETNQDLMTKGYLQVLAKPDQETLLAAYLSNDVYVQTSLYEGFCLPAAEAQAVGLPVVYTRGSGIDEVVFPGHAGGLTRENKASEWLEKTFDVYEKSQNLKPAFENWIQSRPTWKDSAELVKKLYNQV